MVHELGEGDVPLLMIRSRLCLSCTANFCCLYKSHCLCMSLMFDLRSSHEEIICVYLAKACTARRSCWSAPTICSLAERRPINSTP